MFNLFVQVNKCLYEAKLIAFSQRLHYKNLSTGGIAVVTEPIFSRILVSNPTFCDYRGTKFYQSRLKCIHQCL